MPLKLDLGKIDFKSKDVQNKIGAICFGIFGIFAFFKWVYVPLGVKMKKLQGQIAVKEELFQTTKKKAESLPELEAEYELLKGELSGVEKKLPKVSEISNLLKLTTNVGRKYAIDITNFKPRNSMKKTYYTMHPIGILVSTRYHKLGKFMAEMGQQERVIGFKDMGIAAGGDEKNKYNVKVRFSMCAYTYNQE